MDQLLAREQKVIKDIEFYTGKFIPTDPANPSTTAELGGPDGMGFYYRDMVENLERELRSIEEEKFNFKVKKPKQPVKQRPPPIPLKPIELKPRAYVVGEGGELKQVGMELERKAKK